MKITSILDALEIKLDSKFKRKTKYYMDDMEQDVKVPAFFMQVLPVKEDIINKYHYEQRLVIVITYLHDKESKYELNGVIDDLRKLFSTIFKVEDRSILIQNKEWEILSNDRLNFMFSLEFVDGLELEDLYDYYPAGIMRELYVKGVDE